MSRFRLARQILGQALIISISALGLVAQSFADGVTGNPGNSGPPLADTTDLSDMQTLTIDGLSYIIAFHSSKDCRTWRMIPGALFADGTFYQSTEPVVTKIDANEFTGVTTTLEMSAQPQINESNLKAFREQIAIAMQNPNDPSCIGVVKSAADVLLQPAYSLPGPEVNSPGARYMVGRLPFLSTATEALFNPLNPRTLQVTLDASNPDTTNYLTSLTKDHLGKELVEVYYRVPGITSVVKGELHVHGNMTAKFISAVKNMGCTSTKSSGNTTAEIVGAIAGGVGGAIVGSILGSHDESTTCVSKLLTSYDGGTSDLTIEVKVDGVVQVDGKPILYTDCDDKNRCTTMPLENFVRRNLWFQYVQSNFDVVTTKITEATYGVTLADKLGANGDVKTDYTFNSKYSFKTHGTYSFAVPLYINKLDANSLNLRPFSSDLVKCAQDYYLTQAPKYAGVLKNQPIPLAPECNGKSWYN